ncbi:MAG TPA: hypothetical protein VGE07_18785 [Herpetosiphonaceae bacterium]
METYTLTPAELAILTKYVMGEARAVGAPPEASLFGDAQLREAQGQLSERGLLRPSERGPELIVAEPLALALATTLSPSRRCMLRVTKRDSAAETSFLSFGSESIALNLENADGLHEYALLGDLDAALAFVTSTSGVESLAEHPPALPLQSLAVLLGDAHALSLLTVVAEPLSPSAPAQSVSWIDSRGAVWLVDPSVEANVPSARPVALGQLRAILAALLGERRDWRF